MESTHSERFGDEQSFSEDGDGGGGRRLFEDLVARIAELNVHRSRVDLQGMYCAWDNESQEMFGYSCDEVIGKMHFHDMFVRKDDYRSVWRVVNDRDVFSGEILLRKKDGHALRMWLTVVKRVDKDRHPTGYMVTALNRDEKQRLEHQIEMQAAGSSHFEEVLAKPSLELLTLERRIDEVREELGKPSKYRRH